MRSQYFRPLVQCDIARPADAQRLAGGWGWFTQVEVLSRGAPPQVIAAKELAPDVLWALSAPRADCAGLDMGRPNLMGILNVTPDSFSDGGRFDKPQAAIAHAQGMVAAGADILDIGGESTRPGAAEVSVDAEIDRVVPVIAAIRGAGSTAISIDTRKAPVAQAALAAGATLVNDVAAGTFDPDILACTAQARAPYCLMHAQGDPETMQDAPQYDDVLLDVYDFLEARIAHAQAAGIARHQIIADPGIGFGKSTAHNLALLARISLFHSLGVPILLGASRKRFIGVIADTQNPADRMAGSVAVALAGIAQGVQITRVHDIAQTRQALSLWQAVESGKA
ncbi:Dihydropteroate synthase [Aquimixticola soesokkakensis]|uniref:Dihydropteroate synthase n=1 Tax=Aquimixticola soesokkakensis TaxID=1519096 RepID=A0A1Y5S381_9RHOB|nr:dihydropteroate synthase [Aquimixticola soesokkakensis]SLN31151.1 Dihydropteroate synthase [Aquimixticola soesokkakensis]